jgi:hypothetical protein
VVTVGLQRRSETALGRPDTGMVTNVLHKNDSRAPSDCAVRMAVGRTHGTLAGSRVIVVFRIPDMEAAIATMSTELHMCGDGTAP